MSKSGTLRVNIVGDSGPLENTLKGTSSKIGGFAKTVGKVGAGAVVALGSAAVGAAFKTAAMGDEIAKTAPKLGVSTDQLQEMQYWAERNGVSSDQLERAVGRLNQRIGDGTEGSSKYVDALNGMGVATLDMNGEVRETGDVMADTIKALSDIEAPAERSAAAAEIFGTKLGRELMPALEDGSLSMEEAAQMAHEMGLVMDEDATKAAERFTDSWADIKDAGMGMLRDFGTPVMEFMADRLFPVIQEHLVPALREFADWIGPKLAAAADWIGGFFDDVLLPAFQSLSEWWEENGPAIIAAAQDMWERIRDVSDWIVEKVGVVIGWFQNLGDGTGDLGDTMSSVWESIKGAVGAVVDWFEEHVGPVVESVAELVGVAWEKAKDVFDTVMGQIRAVWDVIGEPTMQLIEGAWEHLKIVADTLWNAIKTIIETVLGVIRGIIDVITSAIQGDWEGVWNAILGIADTVWKGIKRTVETLATAMQRIIDNIMDTIQGLWETAWDTVSGFLSDTWEDIKDGVSGALDDIVGWMRDLPGNMLSALGNLGQILFDAGKAIIDGLWDGLKDMWGNVTGWFSGIGDEIRNLKGPIEKDRVLLTDIGQEIIGGLGRGLEDEWRNVEKLLGTMTAEIPMTVSDANSGQGPAVRRGGGAFAGVSDEVTHRKLDDVASLLRAILDDSADPAAVRAKVAAL